ncbi:response regulator [Sphingomonas sp. RS6]
MTPTTPMNVLIVEDEMLLAMDIEAMVEDCGHHVLAEAASFAEVEALPESPAPDVALVDVQLAGGSSGIDVSGLIHRRWADTVVVFVTANPKKVPPDLAGAHGIIPKPFSRSGLSMALRYIGEGVCDPPPSTGAPPSFIEFPSFPARWA